MLKELRPHNKRVYTQLEKVLKYSYKAIIIQATGTGKGVIANNIIYDLFKGKRILFLVPNLSLERNHIENLKITKNGNVDFITYQKLCSMLKKESDIDELSCIYDVVIMDEVHRAGAQKWSIAIDKLIYSFENKCKYVIGLTATEQRYIDGIYVGDRFFGGNRVFGIDLVDAIKHNILPAFTYVVSLYCMEEEVERVKKELQNIKNKNHPLIRSLKKPLSYIKLLASEDDIISKTVQNEIQGLPETQKSIVFADSIENIEKMSKSIKKWFNRDVNLFVMHSKRSKTENDVTLDKFNVCKTGCNVLLSVNMLNEGVHVKGITGIFMMRKTNSNIIFFQQLGRALAVSHETEHPIIFDFIGNYRNIDKANKSNQFEFIELLKSIQKDIESELDDIEIETKQDFSFKNISRDDGVEKKGNPDSNSLGNPNSNSLGNPNSNSLGNPDSDLNRKSGGKRKYKENNRIIVKNYTEETIQVLDSFDKILNAINKNLWVDSEIDILIQYYPTMSMEELKKKLPNRTEDSIVTKAYKLGLAKEDAWSKIQIELLKKLYPKYGRRLIDSNIEFYDKTPEAVENMAAKLGIKTEKKLKEQEYQKILSSKEFQIDYQRYGKKAFEKYNIPDGVGRGFVRRNGLKVDDNLKWTKEEDDILYTYYPEIGYEVIQYLPNRSKVAIQGRVNKLGIKKVKNENTRGWTLEMEERLKVLWESASEEEILANFPNKSYNTIRQKAQRLGLKRLRK